MVVIIFQGMLAWQCAFRGGLLAHTLRLRPFDSGPPGPSPCGRLSAVQMAILLFCRPQTIAMAILLACKGRPGAPVQRNPSANSWKIWAGKPCLTERYRQTERR